MSRSNAVIDLFADERKQVKQDEAQEQWRERMLLKAINNIMETGDGKLFMWWLLEITHFFQTSFTGNSTTFFREGERNIGNQVMSKLFTVRPQAMQELIEHRNKQIEEKSDD